MPARKGQEIREVGQSAFGQPAVEKAREGFCNGLLKSYVQMETVIQVNAREDYMLELKFNTGETRLFDARPYLEKGVFARLKAPVLFRQAHVAFDTVCWPGNLDIAPETLYDRSRPVH